MRVEQGGPMITTAESATLPEPLLLPDVEEMPLEPRPAAW